MNKTLVTLVASACTVVVSATNAQAAGGCPNAQYRTGPSATLPDCRAYELVSTDSNHASLGSQASGRTSADGQTMEYQTIDAPDQAESASTFNLVRVVRNGSKGWSGRSLSSPAPTPTTSYAAYTTWGAAADLLSTFAYGDQPLTGPNPPPGQNSFVRRPDGTYRLLTAVGTPFIPGLEVYATSPGFSWGNHDFSHVYFAPPIRQSSDDPTGGGNAYVWSEDRGLRLVGILPDGTPAPGGAAIANDAIRVPGMRPLTPASADGKYVAFTTDNKLYLRIDDTETVELGATDVSAAPSIPDGVHVAADGSKVIFTSRAELTGDANTGGGVGRDLYSYNTDDTASPQLKDLTVDADPADAATGADVQYIVGATANASFIYFTAKGNLAAGATPGRASLYVWHDDRISFVADAENMARDGDTLQPFFYVTPDGRHVVFASNDPLTGYDNRDPDTGQSHTQVFTTTFGGAVLCASCRANGTPPTGDSTLPFYHGLPPGRVRVASDDGSRVFFHSTDAIVPQASSGRQVVYEYANGKPQPISSLTAPTTATFLDASASGDDVFFSSYDQLVPSPNAGDSAVFDARVGGGIPAPASGKCANIACQAPITPAPPLAVAASLVFSGEDDDATSDDAEASPKVSVSKIQTISGSAGSLKVKVPGPGRLTVTGAGVRTKQSTLSKAQTLKVGLALTAKAAKSLKAKGSYKTKVKVAFSGAGRSSSVTLSVTFKVKKAGSARKGR